MQIETSRKSMLILRGAYDAILVGVLVPTALYMRINAAHPSLNIGDYAGIGFALMVLIIYIRDIYWTWRRYKELYIRDDSRLTTDKNLDSD